MKKNIKSLLAIAILFLTTVTTTFAQREETIIGDSGFSFTGVWGGWTSNLGQFNKTNSTYSGGMWALEFGKRFHIGTMHYTLGYQPVNNSAKTYSFRSNNLFLGYSLKSYRPVHPIFSLAASNSTLKLRTDANNEAEDKVFILHPAVGAELNLTRWCHIDAQVGYRAVLDSDFVGFSDKDFSGLFGQVNLKFGFSWGRYKTKNRPTEKGKSFD
jgi:hypothetical protein